MYLSHYNLREKPFSISPDPRFLWFGETHKEALAVLKYGILENKGFLLLTGNIGTGKTALVKALVKIIDVTAIVATIPDPGLSSIDFFNVLAEEFNMNRTFKSKGEFLIHLKQFLLDAYADDKRVLLVIDEAQRLDHDLLEQIRLLSNIEMDNRKLINIFFVGQIEFNDMLNDARNRAVRQRISVNYHIKPLAESETAHYIQHRLQVAGAAGKIFTAGAIRKIFSFSHGNPRLINIICDHALLTGYTNGLTEIDGGIVDECGKELKIAAGIPTPPKSAAPGNSAPQIQVSNKRLQRQQVGLILIFLLILGVAGYLLYDKESDDKPRWAMEEIAPKQDPALTKEQKEALLAFSGDKHQAGEKPAAREQTPQAQEKPGVAQTNPQETESENNPEISAAADLVAKELPPIKDFTLASADRRTVIHFEHNSNDLPDQAFEKLNSIVRLIAQNPRAEIVIEGYTDSYGNYWYNKKLSKFRADIIKSYFTGQGVPSTRIKALGLGPENPMASNDTNEGRQQNRRVEITVNVKE